MLEFEQFARLTSSGFSGNLRLPMKHLTTDTKSQPSKKLYFYTVGIRILALIQKRDSVPIHKITHKLRILKSAINKL